MRTQHFSPDLVAAAQQQLRLIANSGVWPYSPRKWFTAAGEPCCVVAGLAVAMGYESGKGAVRDVITDAGLPEWMASALIQANDDERRDEVTRLLTCVAEDNHET